MNFLKRPPKIIVPPVPTNLPTGNIFIPGPDTIEQDPVRIVSSANVVDPAPDVYSSATLTPAARQGFGPFNSILPVAPLETARDIRDLDRITTEFNLPDTKPTTGDKIWNDVKDLGSGASDFVEGFGSWISDQGDRILTDVETGASRGADVAETVGTAASVAAVVLGIGILLLAVKML